MIDRLFLNLLLYVMLTSIPYNRKKNPLCQ